MPSTESTLVILDAGLFIGALLIGDPRHAEARLVVEAARRGELTACTTTGILSEVIAALTWHQAQPPQTPAQAADVVRLLIETPSQIRVLPDGLEQAVRMIELCKTHQLPARRVHDARHAAAAIVHGVTSVLPTTLTIGFALSQMVFRSLGLSPPWSDSAGANW